MSDALRVSPGALKMLINASTAAEALMDADIRTASPTGKRREKRGEERKRDEGIMLGFFFYIMDGERYRI